MSLRIIYSVLRNYRTTNGEGRKHPIDPQLRIVCFSDGARARLRLSAGERNDPSGSRRYLHLRSEKPRWIPGESFLLRERRSLWQRQGPGNYFTINLCPPVMDYYLIYYLLLLTLLLLSLLLLLHHLYARVPALHSTAFNCTTASYEKRNISIYIHIYIYILPQPQSSHHH